MLGQHHLPHTIRTGIVLIGGVVLLTLLLSGCAQPPRVYRVGVLAGMGAFFDPMVEGFKSKMVELGYTEGKNIVYDIQKPAGAVTETGARQQVLKKFVADKVDLIYAITTESAVLAKTETQQTNIPVVFVNVQIEGVNLVNSVREPGGNLTGVRIPGPELTAKRFEILRRLAPQAKRVLVPYQDGYPADPSCLEVLRTEAAAAGITLIELPAKAAPDIEADLQRRAQLSEPGIDAVLMIADPLLSQSPTFDVVAKFAREHKIPLGGSYTVAGDYESLFGLSPDSNAMGKLAASQADKILKGTPAGTIPISSPEPYLVISTRAAQAYGVEVPEGLLSMANRVIR